MGFLLAVSVRVITKAEMDLCEHLLSPFSYSFSSFGAFLRMSSHVCWVKGYREAGDS